MTISAFDHPWLAGLVSDAEANACFSAEADLQAMLAFETALAESEAELGLIPEAAARRIAEALAAFQPDVGALAAGLALGQAHEPLALLAAADRHAVD